MTNMTLIYSFILFISLTGCTASSNSIGESAEEVEFLQAPGDFTSPSLRPPAAVKCDEFPAPLTQVQPDRKSFGLDSDVHGVANVKVWVSDSGKVRRAEILHSDNSQINRCCLAAAVQWTFTQARKDGKPVEVWVSIPFKL